MYSPQKKKNKNPNDHMIIVNNKHEVNIISSSGEQSSGWMRNLTSHTNENVCININLSKIQENKWNWRKNPFIIVLPAEIHRFRHTLFVFCCTVFKCKSLEENPSPLSLS